MFVDKDGKQIARLEICFDYDKFSANAHKDDITSLCKASEQYQLQFTIYRHYGSIGSELKLNNVIVVTGPRNGILAFRLVWPDQIITVPYYGKSSKIATIVDGLYMPYINQTPI